MEPVILALQEEFGEEITFIIADLRTEGGYSMALDFGVLGIPHSVIIDSNGEIIYSSSGLKNEDELKAEIKRLEGI